MGNKKKLSNSMIVLGRILIEQNRISSQCWEKALFLASNSDDALLDFLSAEGAGSENELMNMLSDELNVPFIELARYLVDPLICRIIPAAMVFSKIILPLHRKRDSLTLAMADPTDAKTIEEVESMLGLKVRPVLARSRDIIKSGEEVFCS